MISPALRWSLVLPSLAPLAVVLVVQVVEWAGHKWNVHGDFLGMVLLFLVSLIGGGLMVIRALIKVLPILARSPEERTPGNLLCAGAGVAFILFSIGLTVFLLS